MASVADDALRAMGTPVTQTAQTFMTGTGSAQLSPIEERAHADNILLSPEAGRLVSDEVARGGRSEAEILDALFSAAKDTFPREDGWILLSKERTSALLARIGGNGDSAAPVNTPATSPMPTMQPVNTVRPIRSETPVLSADRPAAPVAQAPVHNVPAAVAAQATATDDTMVSFVRALVAVDQQQVFDIVRTMTGRGVAPEAFIGELVRKLDDIYKNRIEGNHAPDKQLAAETATWSNGDFEKVLGILVECIDYSYSSTRIGTKVALAKAFEYFGSKSAGK
jgi:hypothetical protein